MLRGLVFTAVVFVLGIAPSAAEDLPSRLPAAPSGPETSAPIGWKEFCARHGGECGNVDLPATEISLTPETWSVLRSTNDLINRTIEPISDVVHWNLDEKWDYPWDGKGDCEDFALSKRKLLLERGYPSQALLITVVYRRGDAEGHAVLMVKTSAGDFILDNRRDSILNWSDTGYEYLKRQSQQNQNRWVTLGNHVSASDAVSTQADP